MTLWLASFPRSGNTLLRQVLFSGWGILTGSIYARDLGENVELIRSCGHVELRRTVRDGQRLLRNPHNVPVKTHRLPEYGPNDRAIYILRDGRASCVSLWHFHKGRHTLEQVIRGETEFGTWSDHVQAWSAAPIVTTLLHYDDLAAGSDIVLAELIKVFGQPSDDPFEPVRKRSLLAAQDGVWVRPKSRWQDEWSDEAEALFRKHNHTALEYYERSRAAA
jgi:hypothetical protein